VGGPSSATVTIADNQSVVSISTPTAMIPEKTGAKGYFLVTRTGDLTSPLNVNYTLNGTATNGADYADLSGVVRIPAGQWRVRILVIPVKDSISEGTETVIATLAAGSNYTVGDPSAATITIADSP
jgi:hypothetical protein